MQGILSFMLCYRIHDKYLSGFFFSLLSFHNAKRLETGNMYGNGLSKENYQKIHLSYHWNIQLEHTKGSKVHVTYMERQI